MILVGYYILHKTNPAHLSLDNVMMFDQKAISRTYSEIFNVLLITTGKDNLGIIATTANWKYEHISHRIITESNLKSSLSFREIVDFL